MEKRVLEKEVQLEKDKNNTKSESEEIWFRCSACQELIYRKDFEKNFKVCPKCDHHFRLGALDRISFLIDEGTFEETDAGLRSVDFLGFKGAKTYLVSLKQAEEKTKLKEAVITGIGKIGGKPVAFGVLDFDFIGGSMGSVVGEKITRLVERAIENNLPLVIVSASGGARMQEGVISLMQMAKTSAAIKRFSQGNKPFISILANPTSGGVTASFASLGDIILAEPGAFIGFAGPRVIEQTIKQKLPKGFQTAEFMREHGMVDKVVHRKELKKTIIQLLTFLTEK